MHASTREERRALARRDKRKPARRPIERRPEHREPRRPAPQRLRLLRPQDVTDWPL